MARFRGPTHKICRRLGISLCGDDRCPVKRGKARPGQHGHKRRRRPSDYDRQLTEKQKTKRIYGILERQFRRYFDESRAYKGETGKVLLQKLERRLDNVVYRLGFARSRPQARQLVRHGKITVNGGTVTAPSFELSPGDKVEISSQEAALTSKDVPVVPEWLSLDKKKNRGIVKRVPLREDIDQEIDETAIVEYYSRG